MRTSDRLVKGMRLLGNQGGFVFIVALIALATLFFAVTSLGTLASGQNKATPYWRDNSEAVYVAESGINHALWKLSKQPDLVVWSEYPDGTPTLTSGDPEVQDSLPPNSSYQVWLKDNPANPNQCFATVLAKAGTGQHLLRMTLKVPPLSEGAGGTWIPHFNIPEEAVDLGELLHTTSDATWDIQAEYYVVHDLDLGAQSQAFIGNGQEYVYIFITGDMTVNAGAEVNMAGIDQTVPKLVFIMMNEDDPDSQTVKIDGNSDGAYMVWSYGATVIMNKNAYVFGSIVGDYSNPNAIGPDPDPTADTVPWPKGTVPEWVPDVLQ